MEATLSGVYLPVVRLGSASSERELEPEIRTQTNAAEQDNKENVGAFSNVKCVVNVGSVNGTPAPDVDCKPYRRVNLDVNEEVNVVKRDCKPARTLKSCPPVSKQGSIRDPLFCARARKTLARVVVKQGPRPPFSLSLSLSVYGHRDASVQTPSPGRRSGSHVLGTPTRRLHACRRLRPDATPRCVPTTVDAVRRLTARPSSLTPVRRSGGNMGCNTSKEAVQPVEEHKEEDKPREEARTISGVTGNKVEEEIGELTDACVALILSYYPPHRVFTPERCKAAWGVTEILVGYSSLSVIAFYFEGKVKDRRGKAGEIKDLHHCSPRACADDGWSLGTSSDIQHTVFCKNKLFSLSMDHASALQHPKKELTVHLLRWPNGPVTSSKQTELTSKWRSRF
uniref:Uncharacterized protein n=1 Tax=Timema monikensis TaxID=170555 RepID=A0A7R9HQ30_9NEOP|nr:unnamed protein product [Timema monikensis]